jgi:hypothetical protein
MPCGLRSRKRSRNSLFLTPGNWGAIDCTANCLAWVKKTAVVQRTGLPLSHQRAHNHRLNFLSKMTTHSLKPVPHPFALAAPISVPAPALLSTQPSKGSLHSFASRSTHLPPVPKPPRIEVDDRVYLGNFDGHVLLDDEFTRYVSPSCKVLSAYLTTCSGRPCLVIPGIEEHGLLTIRGYQFVLQITLPTGTPAYALPYRVQQQRLQDSGLTWMYTPARVYLPESAVQADLQGFTGIGIATLHRNTPRTRFHRGLSRARTMCCLTLFRLRNLLHRHKSRGTILRLTEEFVWSD